MAVKLNNRLIDFFSEIEIKFEWKIFGFNIMDYFSLLKQGITLPQTYYNVIVFYGMFNSWINMSYCRHNKITDKIIYKILNKYNESYEEEDPFLLTATEIAMIEYDKIKDDLNKELMISNCLKDNAYMHYYSNNLLLSYLPMFSDLNIASQPIRLLSDVYNDDKEDMTMALYVDEVNYYIGYMDLYQLAISRNNIKIANMLKEMMIIQYFYIKEVLDNNFDNVTDLTNMIFKMIII